MVAASETIGVLCVDDNAQVAFALRRKLLFAGGFRWTGWLDRADTLLETAPRIAPDVVLLDIDMPGLSPFAALESVTRDCPNIRVVVFTGVVRRELIDRALDTGAWGYVSKTDGEDAPVEAIRLVRRGELVLSSQARSAIDGV